MAKLLVLTILMSCSVVGGAFLSDRIRESESRKQDANTQRHPVSLEVNYWYIIRDGLGPIDIAHMVRSY